MSIVFPASKTVVDSHEGARGFALLVLGMHRSGTSSVAGSLVRLGGAAPLHLLPPQADNERGFFESDAIMALNNDLLAAGGSCWREWRRFDLRRIDAAAEAAFRARARAVLAQEFGEAQFPIVKDPRMCRLMPFWMRVFEEAGWSARAVLSLRSPLEVALSLNRRDGLALSHGCLIWLRHELDAEGETRNTPRAILDWDEFLVDRRGSLERIGRQLDLAWPRWSEDALAEIDEFVSVDLHHQTAREEDSRLNPAVSDLVREAYAALLRLADDPASRAVQFTLDDINARFDEAAAIFDQPLLDLEEEQRRLCSRASAERQEFAGRLAAAQQELAQARAERDSLTNELAAARDQLSQVAAARDGLTNELAAARDQSAEIAAARDRLAS